MITTKNKHVKVALDKNGHRYMRIVNNEVSINKTDKIAGSTEKVVNWWDKYKRFDLNKYPAGIPKDKVVVTFKEGSDPNSKSIMHWRDASGKQQDAYTKEFLQRNADEKWKRIATVNQKIIDTIKEKAIRGLTSKDNQIKQSSAIILIIAETGLRPGSVEGYNKTKNRGVTTLAPDNLIVKGDSIQFNFKGKSYKDNYAEIQNKDLADTIKKLQKKNKGKDFLFDVTRNDANKVFKEDFGFKGLKLKDMRTYIATAMAKKMLYDMTDDVFQRLIAMSSKPKAIICKKLKQVYEAVSQKLNNSPAMAKSSYIHPNVKKDWLAVIGISDDDLLKSLSEDFEEYKEDIKDILTEKSLDLIVKKYPPVSGNLSIDEEAEEECDLYPLEDWEEDETDESLNKAMLDSLEINKSFLGSEIYDAHRQNNEYKWEKAEQELKKDLSKIEWKTVNLPGLYKCLFNALEKAVVNDQPVVDLDASAVISMKDKADDINVTTGGLLKWLKNKRGERYEKIGMPDAKKITLKCNDNPYVHSLAKAFNITKFDEEFVENNEILTSEIYDLLSKGEYVDEEMGGVWGTDIEKAKKDLSKYKMVRKLVYRDGKSYMTTVYMSNSKEVYGEDSIKLSDDETIHKHAKAGLEVGDAVFFTLDGELMGGVIVTLKHHPVTDKFGTAVVRGDDGKMYSKSLKLIERSLSADVDLIAKTPKEADPKLPNNYDEFDWASAVSLGGSGGTQLVTGKNGKKYVLKLSRLIDEKTEQLKQEVLCDKLYRTLGMNAPVSTTFEGDGKTYKVSEYKYDVKQLNAIKTLKPYYDELKKGFVADCLFANWDVIGSGEDNILVSDTKTIRVSRIDNGGSLMYRAQGRRKGDSFGNKVVELTSFLDSTRNPGTAKVFKGITDEEINAQINQIIKKEHQIYSDISNSDCDYNDKIELTRVLKARMTDLKLKVVVSKSEVTFDKTKYDSQTTSDYFEHGWDEVEVEGNPGMKEAMKKHILEVERNNDDNYRRAAKDKGVTLERYKELLQKQVEKLVGASDFYRSTDLKVLGQILHVDKRWKSQFETETSHGCLSPRSRAETEHSYFGFDDDVDIDKDKRCIYGYFSNDPNGIQNDAGKCPPPNNSSHYGEVTVKFKRDKVLKKTTVAFYDTLGTSYNLACTPALKPHFTSLGDRPESKLEMTDTSKMGYYNESQYHNQLKVEDIESIHYSPLEKTYSGFKKLNEIIEVVRKSDVPLQIFGDKDDL